MTRLILILQSISKLYHEFELQNFHLGPVIGIAYEPEDYHLSLGIHIAYGF